MTETQTTSPLTPEPFVDPYRNETDTRRLVADIAKSDFEYIYSMRPIKGTLQTTVNILWKKLHDALKSYGLNNISQQRELEQFILGCRIVPADASNGSTLQRSPVTGVVPEASSSNDSRGVKGVGAKDTTASHKSANISRSTGRRK